MTAGYSNTPQIRKLGIKASHRVRLDHAPADWHLDNPPPGLLLVGPVDPVEALAGRQPFGTGTARPRLRPSGTASQ